MTVQPGAAPDFGGPVSADLAAELAAELRAHGIVVWLDGEALYPPFVARLAAAAGAGELPYAVYTFAGSYLDALLALDGLVGGSEKPRLLLHLPGFNEDRVAASPLYALYAAGTRFRKALDTLVRQAAAGTVRPEEIEAFVAAPGLTLARADAWLAERLTPPDADEFALALRALGPAALVDDLLAGGFVAGRLAAPAAPARLWQRLGAALGLTAAWRAAVQTPEVPAAADAVFAAASFALAVEYVHDLEPHRPPVSPLIVGLAALPRPLADACSALAAHLRERHRDVYRRTARETEALLADEVAAARAEDLGQIDTFRFEEDTVLTAALAALEAGAFARAAAWARARVAPRPGKASFWLGDEPERLSAWQLVAAAAELGLALERAGARLQPAAGPDAALEAYVARGAAVDRAHRLLEQRAHTLLLPQLPEFETLRARLADLRQRWRQWADAWARDFNAGCRTAGFLPAPALQQRNVFADVVLPFTTEPGLTAYFLVDALRFELGQALAESLGDPRATTVQLQARLAELPTVTEVGMNVLVPPAGAGGRLVPLFAADNSRIVGLRAGELRVADPETRRRALHERVGGTTCPWLELAEVTACDAATLKRKVAQARLVVVHSRELDRAGESGAGPAAFDAVVQQLTAAWRLLRDAGVRRFVFTGDHGFLLGRPDDGAAVAHGRRIDPKRRHVFSPVAADHPGEVRVALAELGYDAPPLQLMLPETTAPFDTGERRADFMHGGNSLQERVIPVLTVVHRAAAGGAALRYAVTAEPREAVAGLHCIAAEVVVVAQQALDFAGPKELALALRVREAPDVQVELGQTRGAAQLVGGVVRAQVGVPFELFFRLTGPRELRVEVELFSPGAAADLAPAVPAARFAVAPSRDPRALPAAPPAAGAAPPASAATDWLAAFAEPGVRAVFAHLASHGVLTEDEALRLLGSGQALRQFARGFETYAARAPFALRIESVAGVKRYVREGPG